MTPDAKTLLDAIAIEQARNSETLHRLSRRQRILQHAATLLRTGTAVTIVEAHLEEQLPHAPVVPILRRTK